MKEDQMQTAVLDEIEITAPAIAPPAPITAVSIAKDVISLLEEGKLRARHRYLHLSESSFRSVKSGGSLQAAFAAAPVCGVCGIGALFVAKYLRLGGAPYSDPNDIDDVDISNELAPWFTETQLQMIEVAFERNNTYLQDYLHDQLGLCASYCSAFGKRYRTDRGRLLAIMKNIIDNGGVFNPCVTAGSGGAMRKLVSSDEAPQSDIQHKRPCLDCPWRRDSLPGWLGGHPARAFIVHAHGDDPYPCHRIRGPECAGMAIYRANVGKISRDEGVLRLPKDRVRVFGSPQEFLIHHGKPVK